MKQETVDRRTSVHSCFPSIQTAKPENKNYPDKLTWFVSSLTWQLGFQLANYFLNKLVNRLLVLGFIRR